MGMWIQEAWQDFSTRVFKMFGYQGRASGMITQNTFLEQSIREHVEGRRQRSVPLEAAREASEQD